MTACRVSPIQVLLLVSTLVMAALALAGWRRRRRRLRALSSLLDAADALEARLRAARAEIVAVTDGPDPVRDALQEMLRQRLWLQRHGGRASPRQLAMVRDGVAAATRRIDGQLQQVALARVPRRPGVSP